ncbi:glycosyltransferase family 4 protein [Planctomycetales bacterium ZRK34]|nr:glycosyltransferase family 4 protein [Planctomycetales bacterium ZRK34]
MRICLYSPSFGPRPTGTHITVDALARQFTQRGHLVSVLALGDPHTMKNPFAVNWLPTPFGSQWFPERSAGPLREFQQVNEFEVICAIDAHPTGYGALKVAEEFEIPLVLASMHGDVLNASPLRGRGHLWKRVIAAYRNADAVVAISPYMHQLLESLDEDPEAMNLVSIHNGVDTESFSRPATRPDNFDDPRPFLLCVGDLTDDGGVSDSLTAMSKMRDRLGDTTLVVLGDGPRGAALRKLTHQLRLDDRVHFVGARTGDARRWFMQRCRYAMIVPHEQGNPMAALQVAAAGRPVVCTSPSAFDDICRGGVNGLRVPAASPNTLADAMARMQRFDLETMGLNSFELAQDYDWSDVASRYLELFELLRAGARHDHKKVVA